MSDEVDLWHAGKHESLPQIDSMEMVKNSQSSQNSKFAMSLQYFKKEVKAEVGFLYADYQWASSSVFKLVKVTSLQYLCSISKKKLGMEIIFGMQINYADKVSTSWFYPF